MKKILMIVAMLLITGCKGKDGAPGLPSSTMYIYQGSIIKDPQEIYIPTLKLETNLSVYVGDASGEFSEIPAFLPGLGKNVWYTSKFSNVTIGGTNGTGLDMYKIVVIKK